MQIETTETIAPTRLISNPREITNLKKLCARSISTSLSRLERTEETASVLDLIVKNNKPLYINGSSTAFLFFSEDEKDLAQEIYNALRKVTFLVLRDWADV